MPQISLDNLVAALASSVAEAEHAVRLNQLRNLRSFFDANNNPVTVEIEMPKSGLRAGETGTEAVHVPLLTLVGISNMSIAEMEVTFQTSLGDVEEATEVDDDGLPHAFSDEDPEEEALRGLGWSGRDSAAIGASTGPSTSESGKASVTLKVRQSELPEGLARIIARLNQQL